MQFEKNPTSYSSQIPKSISSSAPKVLTPLSSERFSQIFPVYISSSDEKQQMIESYARLFAHLSKERWSLSAQPLLMKDIGCGNGTTTELFLESFRKYFLGQQLHISAIDADSIMLQQYQQRINANLVEGSTCSTETGNGFQTQSNSPLYDLVLVSHSLYHTTPDSLPDIIKSIQQRLKPSGVALLSLLSDDSDFQVIQDCFVKERTAEQRNHLSVDAPTFDVLKTAAQSTELVSETYFVIPYEATLTLPIHSDDFEAFTAWAFQKIDAGHSDNPPFEMTKALLEFMLHKDWESSNAGGVLGDYLELVSKLIKLNGPSPESGNARLTLNGATLVLCGSPDLRDELTASL